jgi:hypothetical protein
MAFTTWAKEMEDRPTIDALHGKLTEMFGKESARLPALRDVGRTCYLKLEKRRGSKQPGERGGSLIRPVKTIDEEDDEEGKVKRNTRCHVGGGGGGC